jgi:hypothetical protein
LNSGYITGRGASNTKIIPNQEFVVAEEDFIEVIRDFPMELAENTGISKKYSFIKQSYRRVMFFWYCFGVALIR